MPERDSCCLPFEQELFSHIEALEKNLKSAEKARGHVRDRLTELAPIFLKQKFMLGDEFSMLDVAIAPLAVASRTLRHRAAQAGGAVDEVRERIFSRQGFIDALTPSEKVMRR